MAGTNTISEIIHRPGVKKIKFAWTSDASGNVNGTLTTAKDLTGKIIGLATVPGAGGVQPTDLYDIEVRDADGVDVLFGGGANRSNASNQYVQSSSLGAVVESTLELVVTNAGNAKSGTAYLFIQ